VKDAGRKASLFPGGTVSEDPRLSASNRALKGIRVIDMSRVLAGPFCGAILGDLGAEVIKVEDAGEGDELRAWPPHKEGESPAFVVNNRNKRGIAVDLKAPEGTEIVRRLAGNADVLIENFRTGTMEKFGLGYESLAAGNPKLVYCSISAFGRTGPRADEAGYESLMQAFSGAMSITGEPDSQPVRCGPSFLDLATGTFCALGIISALFHRAQSGLGQRVDGSLLETAISMLNYQAEGYLLTGNVPKPLGSAHPSLCPYRNYRCRDGRWIFLAGANDRLWKRVAAVLGLSAMAEDPRYATNPDRVKHRAEVDAAVEKAVALFDREPLLQQLEKAGAPAAPVNTMDQVLNDKQILALPIIQRMVHPRLGDIPVVGFPRQFSRLQPVINRSAPLHGEHTDEILSSIGYSVDEITRLQGKQVIR